MKLRIFASKTCSKCELITNGLKIIGEDFEYIDAMDEANDPICDQYNVDILPHVQLLDDNGNIVWEKAKGVSLTSIMTQLKANETES